MILGWRSRHYDRLARSQSEQPEASAWTRGPIALAVIIATQVLRTALTESRTPALLASRPGCCPAAAAAVPVAAVPVSGSWTVPARGLPAGAVLGCGSVDCPVTVWRWLEVTAGSATDRYSIGDRTPGLVHDENGGLTLYVQCARPTDPRRAANWLPAPDGPSSAIVRIYGPDGAVLDGTWLLPPLTVVH